jgi:hypothetical protein
MQRRIDRATRQLALAAELEERLGTVLQAPPEPPATEAPLTLAAPAPPLARSPARQAMELEATSVLLEAELRAAEILNASGTATGGSGTPSFGTDVARAIEHQLQALAEIERSLVELGTRALQLEDGESPGGFD